MARFIEGDYFSGIQTFMVNRFSIPLGFITILLMASIFIECRKENPYAITGLMTDPNQAIPVEGASIEIWTQQISGGIFEADFKLAGSIVSTLDGTFSLDLDEQNYTAIRLTFKKDGYFGWTCDLNMDKVKNDHGHYAEYQLVPKAELHIRIKNTEPFNSSDYFELRILNGYPDCEECCKAEKYQFTGMEIDQSIECLTAGHQYTLIQWSKRKNGEQIFKTETYFIKAFETSEINFNY